MVAANNDFLTWAVAPGSNVLSQADYANNAARSIGVASGIAKSNLFNKAQRQASFIAACMAYFVQQNQNNDVLDDGNIAAFVANFEAALASQLTTSGTIRQHLQVNNTNYYVNAATGNDNTGDGSLARPWATLQHAWNYLIEFVDLNSFNVILNCSGAFTAGLLASGNISGQTSASSVVLQFQPGSSVTPPAANTCFSAANAGFMIQGTVTLSCVNGNCISTSDGGTIILNSTGINFGNVAGGNHILSANYGTVIIAAGYTISGNASSHFNAGTANIYSPVGFTGTITLIGTPAISTFAGAICLGSISLLSSAWTFVGAATGVRYASASNSVINTTGGGASYFPGNAAGSATAGGLYQ